MASSKQFTFRGALLRTCNDMGEETWRSFCFLYSVPESVRERCRGDVLNHLVDTGEVTIYKSEEFAETLRKSLNQANLADKFKEALSEEVSVETRGSVNRSLHSTDRRGGRHFTLDEIPADHVGTTGTTPDSDVDGEDEVSHNSTTFRRLPTRFGSVTPVEEHPSRHDSMLSMYSDRSSGYYSQRGNSVTSVFLERYSDDIMATTQQLSQLQTSATESSPDLQPRSLSPSSFNESPTSLIDDDFQSCSSGSLESLTTNGSLPRNITPAAVRGDVEIPIQPEIMRRRREQSPEYVDLPTHSTIKKTDTILLLLSDLKSDIYDRLKDKVYCSVTSPDRHGIDFKLRFYPINHEETGAALNVDVSSHLEKGVIPPLNITVCVQETNDDRIRDNVCHKKSKDCLAYEQRNSTLTFQGQYTALFMTLVSHRKVFKTTCDNIIIQVTMEYATQHILH